MFDSMRRAKLYAAEDDNEAKQLNEATKTRLETIMTEQSRDEYLKQNWLPKICQGMDYTPPAIIKHSAGPKHEN